MNTEQFFHSAIDAYECERYVSGHRMSDDEMVWVLSVGDNIIRFDSVPLNEAHIGYYEKISDITDEYNDYNRFGNYLINDSLISSTASLIKEELEKVDTFDCASYMRSIMSSEQIDISYELLYRLCYLTFGKMDSSYDTILNTSYGQDMTYVITKKEKAATVYDNSRSIRKNACELLKLLYSSIDPVVAKIIKTLVVTVKTMPELIELFEKNTDNGIISKEKFPQFYEAITNGKDGEFKTYYMKLANEREFHYHEAIVIYSYVLEEAKYCYGAPNNFSSYNFEENVNEVKKVFKIKNKTKKKVSA